MTYTAEQLAHACKLGTSTLFEASGLDTSSTDIAIRPVWAGASIAGPAYPLECSPGDNLSIHIAMEKAPRGSILVISTGGFVAGYWGEVLTVAAEAAGIAGLVIDGDAPKRVIIRGVGPGLVPTVAAALVLANPTLQLNKLNTVTKTWEVVGANDDWGGSAELATAMSQAGMGALAADSKDAVLLIELQPGIYTAQLSGVGATTGIGLVEIYEAP